MSRCVTAGVGCVALCVQVVDVSSQRDESGAEYYDWILAFQCVEKDSHIQFIGANFYSREINDGEINLYMKHGL